MVALLPLLLLAAGPAAVSGSGPVDFLVGDWAIYDQAGKQVGTSHVDAQVPGSMLLEMRRVDGEPQPLWWENSEREGGWIQLFIGPKGQIRAFTPVSKPGEWPLVIGADVVLQDGTPARFRVTMPQPHDGKSLRKLEMSKDSGRSWSTVFAYEYRRVKP